VTRTNGKSLIPVLGVLVVLGAAAAASLLLRPAPPEVPVVDLTEAELSVREAVEAARAAVLAEPRSEAAWRLFGYTLDAHDLYEDAVVAYDVVLAFNPTDQRTRYQRALCLEYLGEAEGAGAEYSRLLDEGFGGAAIHFRLGEFHNRAGDCEAARDAFQRSLSLEPDSAIARRGLGNAQLCLGEDALALETLQPLLLAAPDDLGSISALVQAFRRNGSSEKARELSESLPESNTLALADPDRFVVQSLSVDSEALFARSKEKEAQGRFPAANEDLRRLELNEPRNALYPARIGRNFVRMGQPREAISYFSKALAIDPTRSITYYNRGIAQQRAGDRAAAVADFRRTLKFDPEYEPARAKLRELGESP